MTETWAFSMRLSADLLIPTWRAASSAVMPDRSRNRLSVAASRRRRTVGLPDVEIMGAVWHTRPVQHLIGPVPDRQLRCGTGSWRMLGTRPRCLRHGTLRGLW